MRKKTKIIYSPTGKAEEYAFKAANLYKGCVHGCVYCFVPRAMRESRENFSLPTVRKDVLREFEIDAEILAGTDERVLMSFATDPYQPIDNIHQITRKAILLCRENKVPFVILTKGGTRACRDFDLYGPDDVFASTLTFLDRKASMDLEPHAALPADRIQAIRMASELSMETWVSLEPVIDPWETLKIITETHNFVDHYLVGKLNYAKTEVDWFQFGSLAVEMLGDLGCSYYIKQSLQPYLDDAGVEHNNTDRRRISGD